MHPRTTLGAPPPLHAVLFHQPHEHERHHGRADAPLVVAMVSDGGGGGGCGGDGGWREGGEGAGKLMISPWWCSSSVLVSRSLWW